MKKLLCLFILTSFSIWGQGEEAPGNGNGKYEEGTSEMQVYRVILNSRRATYQHVADIVIMDRGEWDNFPTKEARRKQVTELGIYDFSGVTNADEPTNHGAVAKAIMNQYEIPKGVLFWAFGFERYALKDLANHRLVLPTYSEYSYIRGSALVGMSTSADEFRTRKKNWGKSRMQMIIEETKKEQEELKNAQ